MASARPSSFKKGGGFLNGVDGTITGYQFTDEFNGVAFTPGKDPKTKKERFHSLYCALSVRADGADEDVTSTLFVGGADDFIVSEDGHTLEPVEDGRELGANTGFAKLITSMCSAGFPDTLLPEDSIDFSAIIGTRARFVQKKDEETTKRLGKRKAKNGKEYDYQDLLIDQVYELPGGKGVGKSAAAGKTAAKGNGKAAAAPPIDLDDLAGSALVEMLTRAGKPLAKAKLSMLTLTTPMLKGNPAREDVRKYLFNDDNLAGLADAGLINFDTDTQTLSLVAES
jgi:hypothetical protein